MAYGKERESFLCEIKPVESTNSTCDFENFDFEDDLSSSSSVQPAETELIATKIAAIPKGDIVSVKILDGKFIFICKKRQESLKTDLKSNDNKWLISNLFPKKSENVRENVRENIQF